MARTKIIPPEGLLSDLEYTSVIVNYSNGIDSTGTDKNFLEEKIIPLYCNTICEYPEMFFDKNEVNYKKMESEILIK